MERNTSLILPKPVTAGADIIRKRMDAIIVQLPHGVEQNAWAAAAMSEANGLSDDIDPRSVARCIFNLAFLGLFPGKALGHAHLVPFKREASLVIGYKGWLHLAYQTGYLSTVYTDLICQGEHFEHYADENGPHFKHVPRFDRKADRSTIIGAYCTFKTKDGNSGFRLINGEDIQRSDKKRDVWNSDFASMVRKTAILRARQTWNTTARIAHAGYIEEQYERDERQMLPPGISLDDEPQKRSGLRLPTDDE